MKDGLDGLANDGAALFGDWLAKVLSGISANGFVSEESLATFDDMLRKSSVLQRKSVLRNPEQYLGEFEQLPDGARAAVRAAVSQYDEHHSAAVDRGGIYLFVTRRLLAVHFFFERNSKLPLSRPLAGLFAILGFGFRKSGELAIRKLRDFRYLRRAAGSGQWDLAAVLIKSGVDIPDLAVCYATRLTQRENLYACWRNTARNIVYSSIVGIDFIANEQGFWLIECNIGIGIDPLYDMDQFTDGLADHARKYGLRNLAVVNNETAGIALPMRDQYESSAKAAGLSIRIIDRASCPRNLLERKCAFPDDLEDDTLAARILRHPTAVDYLMGDKVALLRAMRKFCAAGNDVNFLIPPSLVDVDSAEMPGNKELPNFVYKLTDVDGGAGVVFIKAESLEHAKRLIEAESRDWRDADLKTRLARRASSSGGEYQPFIASTLLEDRRLYKIRTHAIISPFGVDFLSANRVISQYPMPETVPDGILDDSRPFMVNLNGLQSEVAVPEHERDGNIAATLDVARAVKWSIEHFFQVDDSELPGEASRTSNRQRSKA